MKRLFLIVLDSVGIGELPDAANYGDVGSNTLKSASKSSSFNGMPNMRRLGYFNIDGVDIGERCSHPAGAYARLMEASKGKDTTIGHWEIAAGPVLFMLSFRFEAASGRKVLCNKPYSGTEVIKDYGEEHMKTGDLIVYTSADSVFQIAAHEDVVPVEKLYEYCKIARKLLTGEHGVGRVIARPFVGSPGNFTRTTNRHDFSIEPPKKTILDVLNAKGFDVLSVGKIVDIFTGRGITKFVRTTGNADGIDKTLEYMDEDFCGLCFTNLVDFDMLYGHRNNIDGYAAALSYFDDRLPEILDKMRDDDLLMITADHGCDPGTASTDHSREYIPLVMYGKNIKADINYHTRETFADIGATVLSYFGISDTDISGTSIL